MPWATIPVCDGCWQARQPGRVPVRLREPEEETCHDCKRPTTSGIYVRAEVQ